MTQLADYVLAMAGSGRDGGWPKGLLSKHAGHYLLFHLVQVNIDFADEQDMIQKMRIGLALQPVATALFSNSPFRGGQDTGDSAS